MKAGTDDWGLLWRYVHQRDEQAFAALALRHVDLVYSAAVRPHQENAHDSPARLVRLICAKARSFAGFCNSPIQLRI